MRVTALIGAGGVLDLGAPSTTALTQAVRVVTQIHPDGSTVNFLEQVADAVDAAAMPSSANFEDYLHAVEALYSMFWASQPKMPWSSKPILSAFGPQIDPKWFDQYLLPEARRSLIETVGSAIVDYMQSFNPANHAWFRDFWRDAIQARHWDIATTNYDDSIERCLPVDAWRDGFVALERGLRRFDAHNLALLDRTRLLHLHGSVLFGYPRFADPNRFVFEDDHENLYKYDDPVAARQTWFGRSTRRTQSREEAIAGPIITGLRKADKLMCHPYDAYQVSFQEAVRISPRLLVAGYSFGDHHLNHVLQRVARLHGNDRRVVLIARFLDSDRWCSDPSVMDWPENHETFAFIARAFRETRPFPTSYTHPLISSDGTARIYLGGMKDALEKFGSEIISFLTT